MKEYINYKELFEIAYELINKELDLGVDNKDRYHHLSMNTNMYENTIDVYMVDCVALDEEEHFYLLSSTYEMDFNPINKVLYQYFFLCIFFLKFLLLFFCTLHNLISLIHF